MTLAAGILSLVLGMAYCGLGAIAVLEMWRGRGRGWSHLGGAFALMAATCGPHHLVQAAHLLVEGHAVRPAHLAALAIGVVPGAVFVGLRAEAMSGGRGDRVMAGRPLWLLALPWLVAVAAGAIGLAAVRDAVALGLPAIGIVPNAILLVSYLTVGIIVLRTQVARHRSVGSWSLSGLALGAVFPTCGLSHLVAGLTAAPELHTLVFDVPGVPASLYFLYVVHRLHRRGLRDWHRRPIAGRPAETSRRSPWAAAPAAQAF